MDSPSLITAAVGAGLRFAPLAWRRAWGAMLLCGLAFGGFWAQGVFSPTAPWRWGALLVVVTLGVVVAGGLYRLALGDERPGPVGLQWGGAEWRLSAVLALSATFLSVLALLAFVVVLAFAFAVASAGHGFVVAHPATWASAVDGRGRAIVGCVGAVELFGLVWAAARISMGGAASIALGKVQVLASWPVTRGLVAPILIGGILLGGPPFAGAITLLGAVSVQAAPFPGLTLLAGGAAGLLLAGLWLPTSVGLMAYLYRHAGRALP